MIKQRGDLILDYMTGTDAWGKEHYLTPENGTEISINYSTGKTKICRIVWNYHTECPEIHTYDTKLQDCITSWELYKEFVELVDEAYRIVAIAIINRRMD